MRNIFCHLLVVLLLIPISCTDISRDRTDPAPDNPTPDIPDPDISQPLWSLLLGSAEDDIGVAMARSNDAFFITGISHGDYQGEPNRDDPNDAFQTSDIILSKVGLDGTLLWSRTFGTAFTDTASDIAIDQKQNIIVGGGTFGSLQGGVNKGEEDAAVLKFDPNGNLLWATHIGSTAVDHINAVTVNNNGDIFVAGFSHGDIEQEIHRGTEVTADYFVSKLNSDGEIMWVSSGGTNASEIANDLAVDDAGALYLIGNSAGDLNDELNAGNSDIFVLKLDPLDRLPLWTRLTGTSASDFGYGLKLDTENNLYFTGTRSGFAFITKTDLDNNELWTHEVDAYISGSSGNNIAILDGGDIMLGGNTTSPVLEGVAGAGSNDVFILRFTAGGSLLNTSIFGNANSDLIFSLIAADNNSLYALQASAGDIYGHLGLGKIDTLVYRIQ